MAAKQTTAPHEITTMWNKNFIIVMITTTLMTFGHFTINPFIASYTKYLGTTDQLTGFLAGMFFGVAFAFRPVSGPLITRLDKRILLMLTLLCGSVASLGYALFENVAAFAFFRFLHGLEYSFLGTLVMTLASDNLPIEKMASGMGIYTIGSAVGMSVSPLIGEALIKLGTGIRDEGMGFTVLFLFSSAVLALAIIPVSFLYIEKKTKKELAGIGAWYKNIIAINALPLAAVILLIQTAYSLYNIYMIEFGKEQGIANITVFYTVLAITLAISRPLSGMLTDGFGVKKVIIPGMVVFMLSFLVVGSGAALWMVLIGAVLAAIGFGSSQPPIIAMSMKSVHPLKRAVASNTVYMGIDLGLFFGPLYGGFIVDRFNYSTLYKTAIAPVVLGLVLFALFLPSYKRRLIELERER